ncbi:FAD-dependent monooxygenase [Rhizobium sp. RAF36]|uniref:FAD-dependent monooxygenase n=1 Tax=Rhizobium sp. RAF36 TaxID=3233055 RepID=UPI003F99FAEC
MKILIAGAGIAGLATARALQTKGFDCEVVERRPDAPTEGAGIFLLGNASRALGDLELLDDVKSAAYPIMRQTILSSSGTVLNDVWTEDVWKGCGPCLALPRRSLIEILQKSLAPETVRYGVEAVTTSVVGDKRMVRFSDGQERTYDLVIGAAGVNSPLRNAVFGPEAPRQIGISCWRLVVPNNGEIEGWTAMLGKGRTLLGIPLSTDETYIYADCQTPEFADGSIANLKELFRDFGGALGPVVAGLRNDTQVHRAALQEVPARRWIADRLVLIGDAAHATSPSVAQGAAMAIEDGVVLASILCSGKPVHQALEQFHTVRSPRIGLVQEKSRQRDRLRTGSELVRNSMLRMLGNHIYRKTYQSLTGPVI